MKTHSERHSRGQVLVLATFMLTVFIGFVGLATDAGYFFDYKRRMVAAADAAAVAGAMEMKRDPSGTNVATVARNAAAANGFTNSTNGITVTVNHPPTSGYQAGNNKSVEVLINRPQSTFFMRALGITTTTVAARAVAGPASGRGCVYALDPNVDTAFKVNGGAIVNAPSCSIFVNSTAPTAMYLTAGTACVVADSINITGGFGGGTCTTPTPYTGAPPVDDPFASLQAPAIPSTCDHGSQVQVSGVATLNPGRYCDGILINAGGSATFNPGLYILETKSGKKGATSLTINSQLPVSGTGVTFYIHTGAVQINGGALVTFSAPTSGTWEGILFFQDRSNIAQATISGGALTQLNGVLYFPSAFVLYSGGNLTTTYTTLVAKTLQISGTSYFNSNYASLANGNPITKPTLGE